jgi:hypothetical protein
MLLPSGARRVTALYSGDTGHPASRSNVVTQTVIPTPNSLFDFGAAAVIGATYGPGYGPLGGVIGDFNGDGIADLAIANATAAGQGSVTVLLGNGDGTFRSPIDYPNVGEAWALASGDFNGDGVADLAVAVNGVGVVILLGNGNGSMRISATYPLGKPSAVAVTDINGDGRADLAVLDWSTATLAVLLGNGDGTFQQPVTYNAGGSYPTSLVVADFNGDGTPDFAFVSGVDQDTVSISMGNPDGTLQPVKQQVTGPYIQSVAAGDFNSDGRVDLIVVGSEIWQVLLGNGDGTFQPLTVTDYSTWTSDPVVADFNGDGQLDVALIYGNSGSQGVMFLFGQGDGTFATPVLYAGTSSYLPVGCGAFTGGGKANLALLDTVNHSALLLRDPAPGLVVSSTHASGIWQGVSGANYILTVTNNQATGTVGAIAVTDTLPDGLTAIAISGSGWNCDLPTLTCTRPDSLAPGDSYPLIVLTFNVAVNAPAQVVNTAAVSVGGVNSATATDPTSIIQTLFPTTTQLTVSPSPANLGQSVTLTAQLQTIAPTGGTVVFYDGASILGRGSISSFPGLASFTTNALPSGVRLLHAYFMGNGPFGPSTSPTVSLTVQSGSSQGFSPLAGYAVTGNAYSIVAGDFNGDGNEDLAIANGSGFSVLLGSGKATFQPPVNYTANKASTLVTIGDFNGDGKPDLVTANPSSNDLTVFLGNGDGTFQTGVSYPVGMAPYSIAIGDLNGDGIADLAVPNSGSNSVTILLGKGDGTFQTFVSYPVPAGAYSVVIADFNGDSKPDLAITSSSGSVTILLGNGNGIFQPPVTVPVGGSPVAIDAADFNGDGKVDLVVANGDNNISVLLGKGDGTFQAAVSYAAGANPSALAVGDFNGDGKLDVAVGSGSGGGVSVLLGNGDGTFGAAAVYASGSEVTSLAVADFAGDGKSDLAVTTGNSAFTIPNAVSRPSNRRLTASGATNVLILDAVDSTGVPTCYVNGNLAVNVSNVQLIVNQALGVAPAVDDLNGDRVVNVIDVQIISAAVGLGCAAK